MKSKIASHIIEIIERLQDKGFETYVVGGAVRDFLLGRQPKDYDISTAATPEEIRHIFGRGRARIIGKRFRLVHLYSDREIIEVSTFRKKPGEEAAAEPEEQEAPREAPRHGHRRDRSHSHARQPLPEKMLLDDNVFGTAEEDVWRRDFTANAIFYDPVKHEYIDFTGLGLRDVKEKVVRAVGVPGVRFEEDPVRMLRALKLVGQYGFTLEDETGRALVEKMDLINHASNSRLSLELEKILKNSYSHRILEAFQRHGFLRHFLPFLDKRWDSPECRSAMSLLKERNGRIIDGLYRDSVSLAAAVIALPFAEERFGGGPGELWEYFPGVEAKIWKLVTEVFYPRIFTKRMTHSARGAIFMQPKLLETKFSQKAMRNPAYPHARELFVILNEVIWKDPELREKWPAIDSGRHPPQGRPR